MNVFFFFPQKSLLKCIFAWMNKVCILKDLRSAWLSSIILMDTYHSSVCVCVCVCFDTLLVYI